ncbi:MAG: hypothetical protein AAGG01_03355, partial [Planctomycetota bacterium]
MKRLLELVLLPPTSLYLLIACGICFRAWAARGATRTRRVIRRAGTTLLFLGSLSLVSLSVPQVAW